MKTYLPNKKTLVSAFLLLLALNYKLPAVLAQDTTSSAFGLTAIPPRLEIEGKPGESITRTIRVRNESATTKILNTAVKDFVVLDNKGTPVRIESLPEGTNKWALSPWTQVSPINHQIKPGETKAMTITVIIPDNATPGAHYAVVLHTPTNETTINASGSAVTPEVGTLVYLRIPGDVKEEARAMFDVPRFQEFGPVNFKTTIVNTSDIHVAPAGQIEVTDLLSRKFLVKFDGANIFPESSRVFTSTLDQKWLFGRFKAELVATYGSKGQLLNSVAYFWVLPVRLILALLTIIFLVVAISLILRSPTKGNGGKFLQADEDDNISRLKNKYRDS